jgi:plasmid stability protein
MALISVSTSPGRFRPLENQSGASSSSPHASQDPVMVLALRLRRGASRTRRRISSLRRSRSHSPRTSTSAMRRTRRKISCRSRFQRRRLDNASTARGGVSTVDPCPTGIQATAAQAGMQMPQRRPLDPRCRYRRARRGGRGPRFRLPGGGLSQRVRAARRDRGGDEWARHLHRERLRREPVPDGALAARSRRALGRPPQLRSLSTFITAASSSVP